MAIAYRASSVTRSTYTDEANHTIGLPTGVASGDFIIAGVHNYTLSDTASLSKIDEGDLTMINASGGTSYNSTSAAVFMGRYTGSETMPNCDFGATTGCEYWSFALTGVTDDHDVFYKGFSGTTIEAPDGSTFIGNRQAATPEFTVMILGAGGSISWTTSGTKIIDITRLEVGYYAGDITGESYTASNIQSAVHIGFYPRTYDTEGFAIVV